MSDLIYNISNTIVTALFDAFYICCWICFVSFIILEEFHRLIINPINKNIKQIKEKQEIFLTYFLPEKFNKSIIQPIHNDIKDLKDNHIVLYKAIIKLKKIIDVYDDCEKEQIENKYLKNIRKKIDSMFLSFDDRINNIEKEIYKSKSNIDLSGIQETNEIKLDQKLSQEITLNEKQEQIPEENINDKSILPINIRITFPHFIILEKFNFKHNNTNNKLLSDDIRLLSNELAGFLNVRAGTCMEIEEVKKKVSEHIDILNNTDFNNTINDEFLEPHLKKLNN